MSELETQKRDKDNCLIGIKADFHFQLAGNFNSTDCKITKVSHVEDKDSSD